MTARLDSLAWPGPSARRMLRRGWYDAVRVVRRSEATWLVVLVAATVGCLVATRVAHGAWPLNAYVLPLLLAMNVMSLPRLLFLDAVVAVCITVSLSWIDLTPLRLLGAVTIVLAGFIVTAHTRSRSKLGLQALRGDSMLIDLRDRLATQSELPELPWNWHAEVAMRSAGGVSFSGDFVVAAKTHDDQLLELVVVDVSGKGIAAGTRSLQLSGAFGGLLGSLATSQFLSAANAYLLRQDWPEGFATAVHLAVDLGTGEFELRTAGHPPAVQFHAGSGRWTPHWTTGPVLGVVSGAEYAEYRGQLQVGDVILLYTDGLVETPRRDIAFGIDKLLGEAERLVPEGFEGGAERLVVRADSEGDDRALVLLHRR